MTLSSAGIDSFISNGFVRIDNAFPRDVADEAAAILDERNNVRRDDPATWCEPVIRAPWYADPPFLAAASAPPLVAAIDQLVGAGRWTPLRAVGSFVLRFPAPGQVNDDGWHIDASFPGDDPNDFFGYRVNLRSRDRALLMLLLFTDVSEADGPTRLRVGSHLVMARRIAPFGEAGVSLNELVASGFDDTASLGVATAHGQAGTAFLCHPFLVHAAQRNLGARPRYLAQPNIPSATPIVLDAPDPTPLERSIRLALQG